MKCHQCDNLALFRVGDTESGIPLCLNCSIKLDNMIQAKLEMEHREMNYLIDQMESTIGVYGISPRYPERKIIKVGGMVMNNINISNSSIGVLNTGTIGAIDAAVTAINRSGETAVADAIKILTEHIISETNINNEIKDQMLEILSAIALEAATPKESRKKTVLRALLTELSTHFSGIASLAQLWIQFGPALQTLLRP